MKSDLCVDFPFVKGMSFGSSARKGDFASRCTFSSLDRMLDSIDINTVVLPVTAWQENDEEPINYTGSLTPDDWEIENMVDYIHKKGYNVIIKPLIKVCKGSDFSDCGCRAESGWGRWFMNYGDFVLNMAKIAQSTGCSILSVGSELAASENRETDWRGLIGKVRENFNGYLTYETDETRGKDIPWWDAIDIMSFRGRGEKYPAGATADYLAEKNRKPFILINDITSGIEMKNSSDIEAGTRANAEYYNKIYSGAKEKSWFQGYGLFRWPVVLENV